MRFSARSKVGIILSIVTILTVVSGFLVMTLSSRGTASHAAALTQTFHGHGGQIHAKSAAHAAHFVKHARPALTKSFARSLHSRQTRFGHSKVASKLRTNAGAPHLQSTEVVALSPRTAEGGLLQNFAGLNSVDNAIVNGFVAEPPDQGLCVGTSAAFSATPETVVIEMVNNVVAAYDTSGNLLGETSLAGFFGSATAFSDPKCVYDTSTGTFYFTVLDSDLATFSGIDVAVLNSTDTVAPTAVYFIDMTFPPFTANGTGTVNAFCIANGGCFADQPHIGLDRNAFYISTDEFDFPTQSVSDGASLLILSKEQLQHEAPVVEDDVFEGLSLGGVPIRTLQPAVNTSSSGTEYLLNSFPFADGVGTINLVQNNLGLWTVKNDAEVTTGDFASVELDGTIIKVHTYAFPTTILSTFGTALAPFTYDDRMAQVQGIKDTVTGHIDLWAALGSAVSIPGDPVTRDGIAWFKIDAKAQSVLQQGFVASAGRYLVYPSIMHTIEGSSDIVFTITSPALDPSVAYVRRLSGQRNFGGLKITGIGTNEYNGVRWGDYSAATLSPSGKDVWIAGEFVNVIDFFPDNWGTQVSEVMGDH